jgi:hypothetical protein
MSPPTRPLHLTLSSNKLLLPEKVHALGDASPAPISRAPDVRLLRCQDAGGRERGELQGRVVDGWNGGRPGARARPRAVHEVRGRREHGCVCRGDRRVDGSGPRNNFDDAKGDRGGRDGRGGGAHGVVEGVVMAVSLGGVECVRM